MGRAAENVSRQDPRSLRSRHAVLKAMRDGKPWTRAQLRKETGLSATTVSTVVSELIEDRNLIELPGKGEGSRGRPTTSLVLTAASGPVLGIALGHHSIEVVLANGSGHTIAYRSEPFKLGYSATSILKRATELCDLMLSESGYERFQVVRAAASIPGPISPQTGVVPDDITIVKTWRSTEPAQLLADYLGCPVTVLNDANASALAECREGLGRGLSDFVYIECTRGLGAALVIDGMPYAGADGRVGEIGHIAVPGAQKLCVCGKYGCLESEASTSALFAKMRRIGIVNERTNDAMAVVNANATNSAVARLLHDAGLGLGRVIANMCDLLAPERVVLGGDLTEAWEPLRRGVEEAINRYSLAPVAKKLDVRISELGQPGPALGAIAVATTDEEALEASGIGATAYPRGTESRRAAV